MGATWLEEAQAWNFALYSKHAEHVTLLLYAADDLVHPLLTSDLDYLRNKSGRVWHCRIAGEKVGSAAYYAFRVAGPAAGDRSAWHAFDPEKILLDPYARSVFCARRQSFSSIGRLYEQGDEQGRARDGRRDGHW